MEKEEKNDMLRGMKGDFSDRLGESRNSLWISSRTVDRKIKKTSGCRLDSGIV